MDDLIPALLAFKKFFTVKHITVVVFVALCLVLVCAPHQGNDPFAPTCSDASCPLPVSPVVITVPEVVIEEVGQENWLFDLPGNGWERHEPSDSGIKVFMVKPSPKSAVLLIKEQTHLSLSGYVVDSIRTKVCFVGRICFRY